MIWINIIQWYVAQALVSEKNFLYTLLKHKVLNLHFRKMSGGVEVPLYAAL